MKKFIIVISLALLVSCQSIIGFIYNVDSNTGVYAKRENVDSINSIDIAKHDINYLMLYRTNYYSKYIDPSLRGDAQVIYFNNKGFKYSITSSCSKGQTQVNNVQNMLSNNLVDTAYSLKRYLKALKTVDGINYDINNITEVSHLINTIVIR